METGADPWFDDILLKSLFSSFCFEALPFFIFA